MDSGRSGHDALRDHLALAIITGSGGRVTGTTRHLPFHRKEAAAAVLPPD